MSNDHEGLDRAIALHDDDKHALREAAAAARARPAEQSENLNYALVVGHGILRDKALAEAARHESAIIDLVREARANGGAPNISRVATESNVSRSTLIRKLADR